MCSIQLLLTIALTFLTTPLAGATNKITTEYMITKDRFTVGEEMTLTITIETKREKVPVFVSLSPDGGYSWYPLHEEPIDIKYMPNIKIRFYDSLRCINKTTVCLVSDRCLLGIIPFAKDIDFDYPRKPFSLIPSPAEPATTSSNWLVDNARQKLTSAISLSGDWPYEADDGEWGLMGCKWMTYSGDWERSHNADGICYGVAVSSIVNYVQWPKEHTFTYRDETNNNLLTTYSFSRLFSIINGDKTDCAYEPGSRLRINYDPAWQGAADWNGIDEIGELVKSVEMGISNSKDEPSKNMPMSMRRKFVDVLRVRFGFANAALLHRHTPPTQLEIPEIESEIQKSIASGFPVLCCDHMHAWIVDGFTDNINSVSSYKCVFTNSIWMVNVSFTDGSTQIVSIADAIAHRYIRTYHKCDFGKGRWVPLFDPSYSYIETDWIFELNPDIFIPAQADSLKTIDYLYGNPYFAKTSHTSRRATLHLYSSDGADKRLNIRVYRCNYDNTTGQWIKEASPLFNQAGLLRGNAQKTTLPSFDFTVPDSLKLLVEIELDTASGFIADGLRFVNNGICKTVITPSGDFFVGRTVKLMEPDGFIIRSKTLNDWPMFGFLDGRIYAHYYTNLISQWDTPPPREGSFIFSCSGQQVSNIRWDDLTGMMPWEVKGETGVHLRILMEDHER